MNRRAIAAAAGAAVLWAMSAGASSLEALQAVRKIAAAGVSGEVNWDAVPAQGAFVTLGTGYRPAQRELSVQVASDGAFLYVRMTMKEPDADGLRRGIAFQRIWGEADTLRVTCGYADYVKTKPENLTVAVYRVFAPQTGD